MNKIDFFAGLHGHYLELIVNVFIWQQEYDLSSPLFTSTGACHLQDYNKEYMDNRMIHAKHYSYRNIKFNPDDRVVRIVPINDDLLIGFTNSLLRGGDQEFDIYNLEKDTLSKLKDLSKAENTMKMIVRDFGVQQHYSRQDLRNYFYSKFNDPENGINTLTDFISTPEYHNFPFSAFFSLEQFYIELNNIAKFFGCNFYPTLELARVHKQFLEVNQGYHSHLKCQQIMQDILDGKSSTIPNLTLLEEAWINQRIASMFRCYDLPELIENEYPRNTLIISQAVYNWKSKDYPQPGQ